MGGKNEVRNAILNADDLPRECVKTPEWPVKEVWVRTMNGVELTAFYDALEPADSNGKAGMLDTWALLVTCVASDKDNKTIFKVSDAPALRRKNGYALQRLAVAAMRVNGLTNEDVERLEKNSEATRGSDSGSSLPTTSGSRSPQPSEK